MRKRRANLGTCHRPIGDLGARSVKMLSQHRIGHDAAIDRIKPGRSDTVLIEQRLHGSTPLGRGGQIDDKAGDLGHV